MCCQRSLHNHFNWCKLTTENYTFDTVNIINANDDQPKIALIKTLLMKMGLKLEDLADPETQNKRFKLDDNDIHMFKSNF